MEDNWISVKDLFPDVEPRRDYLSSKIVLVFIDDTVEKAMFQKGDGFINWVVLFGDEYLTYEKYEITHWMPLPEPPKQ